MGQRITTMTSGQTRLPVAPSLFKFAQHGQCGTWVSELLPHTASVVDDIALVKSVHTNAINHDPACTFLMTGSEIPGKASLGSWLSYGLGSENNDLPAFVVLTPNWSSKANAQALFTRMWSSGFLPTRYTGVALRAQGDPVLFLKNPPGVDREARRAMLDALGKLNENSFERFGDPETQTRIAQYEMAFRMQTSVPELTDISRRIQGDARSVRPGGEASPARSQPAACSRAGSRSAACACVQILHRGWDQHSDLPKELRSAMPGRRPSLRRRSSTISSSAACSMTRSSSGAANLAARSTARARSPTTNYGRDHHPRNFCMWMAGGGVKGGTIYGETDDFSYNIVDDPVHLHDLNATILHCLGIDHHKLTFKFQGLDQRLTGVVEAHVVKGVLA